MITKKELENLAELARMELRAKEEQKLLHDLEKILEHVKELQGVDTKDVRPLSGGTDLKNVLRNDTESLRLSNQKALNALPEKEKGFLEVPPVFE